MREGRKKEERKRGRRGRVKVRFGSWLERGKEARHEMTEC